LRHKTLEHNEFSVEAFPLRIVIEEYSRTYGEYSAGIRRTDSAADAKTGNLQKTSLAYGRVLEACVSCHAKFRD
jgi:cytochrome c556